MKLGFWIALALSMASGQAQLRVVTWNISNYNGSRMPAIRTAVYGQFEGRSMAPDIVITQEFLSQAAVNDFRTALNTATGSPGDWQAAPFINGPDTDSAFFYRSSKVAFLGVEVVATGSSASDNQPRNTYRYDIRLIDYASDGARLYCYATHMKAGNTTTDQQRRLVEAERIRADAQTLPTGSHFLLGGDLNVPNSNQAAFQTLIASTSNNAGRFFDPINTLGNWNNQMAMRFVHTQDPWANMDDRFDFILLSSNLIDGNGFDYLGNPAYPYSTTTWNDPNHSYRAWGNDGGSFGAGIRTTDNTMVGQAIAQAIKDAATTNGHLPVFLDLRVPPKVDSDEVLDFGVVFKGANPLRTLMVWNSGNVGLWTANGIAALNYDLVASSGFVAPSGSFSDAAGGGANSHIVRMQTGSLGVKTGTVTIRSNAPDEPDRIVTVMGRVDPSGDVDGNRCVDDSDLAAVLAAFGQTGQGIDEDVNEDGTVDDLDLAIVLTNFGWGC